MRIIVGDCREALRELEAGSIRCCITSPPYFGLRDYGTGTWEGGAEDCDHMRSQGGFAHSTLGAASWGNGMSDEAVQRSVERSYVAYSRECAKCGAKRVDQQIGLETSLDEYVDEMVAVFNEVRRTLTVDGTVWLNLGDTYNAYNGNRGTASPFAGSAAEDNRPHLPNRSGLAVKTLKQKDLLMVPARIALALQADGWYLRSEIVWAKPNPMPESVTDRPTKSHEMIYLLSKSVRYHYDIDALREPQQSLGETHNGKAGYREGHPTKQNGYVGMRRALHPLGANCRDVWTVASRPFPGSHFAVMPEEIAERCVLAGSAPGDTVLDPFAGSGTVGLVANRHRREFVGIELNPEYADMARRRMSEVEVSML